ncbi:MAG: SOS response-associated peptidase [Chlorobium sp.]|nr:SOS response-associated peptidase [Chlorobium sp.]
MCGRFVTVIPAEELKAIFDLIERPQLEPRYNVAPTQTAGVVRQADDSTNHYDQLKWGLVPSWSKDPSKGASLINSRSETVAEKPSFRHAIKKNRCIIPVTGFYEWSHTGTEKHPHYIHLSDKSPMALAGIWENWKSPDGTTLETFSILTTAANKLISSLHERMPVILMPGAYGLWLDRKLQNPQHFEHLYAPFPDELMTYYKVPDLVNNPKFDSPTCIIKV